MVRPPPPLGLTVNLSIIFATVFVSFASQLNRKIRVPRLAIVRVFRLLKLHQNAPKLTILGTKNDFFFLGGAQPPPPHPTPSTATTPRPLLAEILNTPLLLPVHTDNDEHCLAALWRACL